MSLFFSLPCTSLFVTSRSAYVILISVKYVAHANSTFAWRTCTDVMQFVRAFADRIVCLRLTNLFIVCAQFKQLVIACKYMDEMYINASASHYIHFRFGCVMDMFNDKGIQLCKYTRCIVNFCTSYPYFHCYTAGMYIYIYA